MCQLARLSLHEHVWPEPAVINALRAEFGHAAAERLIGLTFDELGEALGEIDAAFRSGDDSRVVAQVGLLIAPCERIGLATIARVARSVVALEDEGEGTAFAASVARLIRIVETSLTTACAASDLIV